MTATKGDTRARLLETALGLFTVHGVEGTSLQMIADALGVTKAAVYYHFKTKDEITEAVAEPALRELSAILDRAADAAPARRPGRLRARRARRPGGAQPGAGGGVLQRPRHRAGGGADRCTARRT